MTLQEDASSYLHAVTGTLFVWLYLENDKMVLDTVLKSVSDKSKKGSAPVCQPGNLSFRSANQLNIKTMYFTKV